MEKLSSVSARLQSIVDAYSKLENGTLLEHSADLLFYICICACVSYPKKLTA